MGLLDGIVWANGQRRPQQHAKLLGTDLNELGHGYMLEDSSMQIMEPWISATPIEFAIFHLDGFVRCLG